MRGRANLAKLCTLVIALLAACGAPAPPAASPIPPTDTPAPPTLTPTRFARPAVDLSSLPVITADNADQLVPLDLLRGHTDAIFEVAFSPDGRTLISSGLRGHAAPVEHRQRRRSDRRQSPAAGHRPGHQP
jgi:hypothetical protein